MDIIKINATDGDSALFVNAVLVSYYDSVIDDSITRTALDTTADNLSKALGQTIKTHRLEKNDSFVHWETSEQVKGILWPDSENIQPGMFDQYSDALIGRIINTAVECEQNALAVLNSKKSQLQ